MVSIHKHIYFVRHGQSEANVVRIREDGTGGLSAHGKAEASVVAKRFKTIPVEVVLSSPYVRAYETGEAIADMRNVSCEVLKLAHERVYPTSLVGKHRDDPEVRKIEAVHREAWITNADLTEGETFNDVYSRVTTVQHMLEERSESHIVVVSHSAFIKLFLAHIMMGPAIDPRIFLEHLYTNTRLSNTGISHFSVNENNKWVLEAWNDDAHLGEL